MKCSIHQNIAQCQFDFDALAIMPSPDLADVGLEITPLPEAQECWWSELEYKHIPKKSGIYAIVNMLNGHFYIGSAISLYSRRNTHFSNLRKNEHKNVHLQRAYNHYGSDAFCFVIVERVSDKESLIDREQHYIDTLNPKYNIARVAGSCLGIKPSEATRKRMSKAQKGRPAPNKGKPRGPMPKETKDRISASLTGKPRGPLSPASIEKREATRKARREASEYAPVEVSEETRARQSIAHKGKTSPNKGKPMPEAQKAKLSEAMKGREITKEHKENISAAMKGKPANNKGKPASETARKNMSAAQKGKKRSPESIAKQTATRKAKSEADPTYGKREGENKQ